VSESKKIRVQSHILKLLGDQLIGHDRLAVFELVKNSYDADSSEVEVELNLDSEAPYISVKDNGTGMGINEIDNGWLEIGTDSKRSAANRRRSSKFKRLPLGEKGVGRLAVQKLGDYVEIITKKQGEPEYSFSVNWESLVKSSKYLGDGLEVAIKKSTYGVFSDGETGTLVKITELARSDWSKRDVRDLYRLLTSLSSPVKKVDSFSVNLTVPGRETYIEDLPSVNDLLASSVWKFKFSLNILGVLTWEYSFTPPKFKGLKGREQSGNELLSLVKDFDEEQKKLTSDIFVDPAMLIGIGPISGEIYAFHRRPEVLRELGAVRQFKEWMRSQSGVRIYRDGVRIFNYGEVGDDWLRLNARRISRPTGKLGTDSLIAHVDLDMELSQGLEEKTNREGFDENEVFTNFHRLTLSIFDKFERLHAADRRDIDVALKGESTLLPIDDAINKLVELAKTAKIEKEIKPIVSSIQDHIDGFKNVMLNAGMAGLNLSLAFHEMVHGVDSVAKQLEQNSSREAIQTTVTHLRKLLDTFRPLLSRERQRKISSKNLVERVLNMNDGRFDRHKVVLSNRIAGDDATPSFEIDGPLNVLIGAINNVLDNAIYWSRYGAELNKKTAAVMLMSDWQKSDGGMIAIVDNGPGFELPVDQLGTPFISNRPDGMGLGLYYSKLVMESMGGSLILSSARELREEYGFSPAYDGAAVIFKFKE